MTTSPINKVVEMANRVGTLFENKHNLNVHSKFMLPLIIVKVLVLKNFDE